MSNTCFNTKNGQCSLTKTHYMHDERLKHQYLKYVTSSIYIALFLLLYTRLFSPRVIFAFLHLRTISPCLDIRQDIGLFKEIIYDLGMRPVLNSSPDNEGDKGENKTGAKISLYTVISMESYIEIDRIFPNCVSAPPMTCIIQ